MKTIAFVVLALVVSLATSAQASLNEYNWAIFKAGPTYIEVKTDADPLALLTTRANVWYSTPVDSGKISCEAGKKPVEVETDICSNNNDAKHKADVKVLITDLVFVYPGVVAKAKDPNYIGIFEPKPDTYWNSITRERLHELLDNYTHTMLYDNWAGIENDSSGVFMTAAKDREENTSLKDCANLQIGVSEYGLNLHGKKLDNNNYLWIYTEKGKVITVELITKKP